MTTTYKVGRQLHTFRRTCTKLWNIFSFNEGRRIPMCIWSQHLMVLVQGVINEYAVYSEIQTIRSFYTKFSLTPFCSHPNTRVTINFETFVGHVKITCLYVKSFHWPQCYASSFSNVEIRQTTPMSHIQR